jgi:hypothetical protein
MANDEKTKLRFEIAHVLFIDIVGYSKLLIDEQSEALQELNQLVRNTEAVREAEAAGQLIAFRRAMVWRWCLPAPRKRQWSAR